jgi:hypothetical protein
MQSLQGITGQKFTPAQIQAQIQNIMSGLSVGDATPVGGVSTTPALPGLPDGKKSDNLNDIINVFGATS